MQCCDISTSRHHNPAVAALHVAQHNIIGLSKEDSARDRTRHQCHHSRIYVIISRHPANARCRKQGHCHAGNVLVARAFTRRHVCDVARRGIHVDVTNSRQPTQHYVRRRVVINRPGARCDRPMCHGDVAQGRIHLHQAATRIDMAILRHTSATCQCHGSRPGRRGNCIQGEQPISCNHNCPAIAHCGPGAATGRQSPVDIQ